MWIFRTWNSDENSVDRITKDEMDGAFNVFDGEEKFMAFQDVGGKLAGRWEFRRLRHMLEDSIKINLKE